MKHFFCLIVFIAFLSICSFSQEQKSYGSFSGSGSKHTEKKILKAARKEFDYGNYDMAVQKYRELLKIDSTNPMYNFEQAQTFYNHFHQTQSIKLYENAIKYSKDSLGEAYYFLASSYHLDGQFDKALINYSNYLKLLNYHGTNMFKSEELELKAEISRKMEMCENGKKLYEMPSADKFSLYGKLRSFQIEPAGKDVNSEYDDYGAVLSANDSVMYFTSRREGTTGGKVDWDDKFFEDIYMSGLGKKGWGSSFPMSEPINTSKHEAIINIAADGKTIYFYRGVKQGTFFYSKLQGNVWTNPEVLYEKSDMNTSAWETSFFGFTIAGSELYVVSDREGGAGGRDIYISKKQADGAWGPLVNMGAPINTKYDEDAPFITADGTTMYFSSKGHNSMGGFDIFKSQRDAATWSQPVNLGRPFNTPGEDIYFILANKSDRAYYSSSSFAQDGTKDLDIYMVDFCDEAEEILLAGNTIGVAGGSISVSDPESGNKIGDYSLVDGKYSIRLKHGKNYRFTFNVRSGSEPVSADILVPRQCKVHDIYQELDLSASGQSLLVRNAFFDIKKEAAASGAGNYSDFLSKLDKASMPLYSEFTLPLFVTLAKADTAKPAVVVSTGTVTAAVTPTVTASTATVITSSTSSQTSETGPATTVTTISINNVLFDYDRSNINPEYASELDKVVAFLKEAKKAKLEVAGHTDSKGTDEYNLALSKRRANAIANYLVSKGISRSRITAKGYGESKPIAANENSDGSDNPEGRAKNRRTEFVVVQ